MLAPRPREAVKHIHQVHLALVRQILGSRSQLCTLTVSVLFSNDTAGLNKLAFEKIIFNEVDAKVALKKLAIKKNCLKR